MDSEGRKKVFINTLWIVLVGLLGAGILAVVSRPRVGDAVALQPAPTAQPVVVHVAGAVAAPGVYTLPPGSRLQDGLTVAGGLLPEADSASLNLAALLQDGQKIVVPVQGNALAPVSDLPQTSTSERSAALELADLPQKVNINTASAAELETLPGIGPTLAANIIAYRQANGPFTTPESLLDVPGIGPSRLEQIQDRVVFENGTP